MPDDCSPLVRLVANPGVMCERDKGIQWELKPRHGVLWSTAAIRRTIIPIAEFGVPARQFYSDQMQFVCRRTIPQSVCEPRLNRKDRQVQDDGQGETDVHLPR